MSPTQKQKGTKCYKIKLNYCYYGTETQKLATKLTLSH